MNDGGARAIGMSLSSNFRQTRSQLPDIEIRDIAPVGRAALWLSLLRRMGLRGIVDSLVRSESDVSHGELVEALVLNRLTSPRPLYRIEEWANQIGLTALTGREPARLNDDRIGRTLDALADRVGDVQAGLTAHMVAEFGIQTTDVNYDTTTLYFEGFHEDSELAARGHSKDGKADHKQAKLALVTSEDGQVPLAHITLAGNVADVTTVPAALLELRRHLETHPVVISGDATMWSQDNMDAVARGGGVFLGPIAMIASVHAWVCAAKFTTNVTVQLTRFHKAVEYQACVAGRFAVNGVADAGTRIVVYDQRRAEEQVEDRRDALDRFDLALGALQKRLNTSKMKTRAALEKALATLRMRHGLATRYVEVVIEEHDGLLAMRWARDEAKLEAEKIRDGRWPLVTNQQGESDEALCAWAIRRYKLHGRIERDMHLVKGPIALRPIFVHNDDRIRSLVAISVWALMAMTLLEREGRKALPPQHKNRVPIIARVEALFATLAVLTVQLEEESTIRRVISPLRKDAESIVRAMGLSRELYRLLADAVSRVGPS